MEAYRMLTASGGVMRVDIDYLNESPSDEDWVGSDTDSDKLGVFLGSYYLSIKLE